MDTVIITTTDVAEGTMTEPESEIVTVLTLRLPPDLAHRIRRHTSLGGEDAVEVAKMLGRAPGSRKVVLAEAGPATLAEAVDKDVADVLGGIPPACPICGGDLDGPHHACEQRVLRYLHLA